MCNNMAVQRKIPVPAGPLNGKVFPQHQPMPEKINGYRVVQLTICDPDEVRRTVPLPEFRKDVEIQGWRPPLWVQFKNLLRSL